MLFRAIYTSAICSARARTKPFIKKFPVTLRLQYPSWDMPCLAEFSSAEDITAFLSTPQQLLFEPITGQLIRPHQVDKIDPDIIYDVAGSGLPYREKGSSGDQVWVRVFERKTALALKETLQNEDPKVMKLPRVIKDKAGKYVSDWEALYQLSDGGIVFLETKYSMSRAHIDSQSERISKSLVAMGKNRRAQLYLAAYNWPDDEDCVSYARNKGYGIIQPNGSDLTVHFKAKDLDFK